MKRWVLIGAAMLIGVDGFAAPLPQPEGDQPTVVPEAAAPSAAAAPQRLAQAGSDDEEPAPPGQTAPPAAPPSGDEPSAPAAGEPGAPAAGEPSAPAAGEPSAPAAGEPAPPAAGEPGAPAAAPAETVQAAAKTVSYGVGFHVRAMFLPQWFLKAFLQQSTSLYSMALGGEFVRRKGNFDLIGSIDFGFYSPPDGNYLGNGKDPRTDTDYVQFRNLDVLAFAAHFIWHHNFNEWLSLVYGAGVGLGIVLGEIFRISNDPERCNGSNAGNESQCYPRGMDPTQRDAFLAANTGTEAQDTRETPHLFKENDVWPVVPIVHLLVGVNFKISDQFSVRVDGGWRGVTFYMGATGHYFF